MSPTTAEEAVTSLGTSIDAGLTPTEVQARWQQYGYNEVAEKKANPLLQFAKKFWGLSAWMLELIILLSWVLHKTSDLYIVSALLVVNAILSFAQEQQASRAVEALKRELQVTARVLRNGAWGLVPARELVPGDIVRIRPGDFVPADVQIIHGELGVDQSALTGESLEVEKHPDELLYSGSIVRRGEANALVVTTGARTYFGRTTELVQLARPRLHIEQVISNVVKWLLLIVGTLLGMAVVASLLRAIPLLETLPLLLVLLLGAIPVALPVMFTVSMAVGSMELARKGVLVTRLSASEDAATMDVLCVDKTGTITVNKLSVANVIALNEFSAQDAILYGALACQEANQDPLDLAFITAAKQQMLLDGSFEQTSFIPFDPQTRRTEAGVHKDGQEFRVMKGAVNVIAQVCGLDAQAVDGLEARIHEFAQRGYRTLAVAKVDAGEQGRLVGLVSLYDMPRPDSNQLIQELRELGVPVKMLTGDALPIAQQIAQDVGLVGSVTRMADLEAQLKQDPAQAAAIAEQSDGFAEIYPEGKYRVVQSLQARGHVVGMTGDGVNDAPALKQAEVGIAVSNATDVAKGAASVVLTGEGLASIVDLVTNGREVYQRIATWIINKISRTILKSAFVVGAFLLTGKYVISSLAMILMIFMTDFVKISLATDNVRGSKKPETWDVGGLVRVAAILGVLMVVESFGMLYIGLRYFGLGANELALHTFSFTILLYFALFSILVVRERRHFWESRPSNTLLVALTLDGIVAAAIATFGLAGMQPIPFAQTLFVIAYAFVFSLVVNDWCKFELVKRAGMSW
jgi:plasma-membrane proton-efflux P-type ATPase